jgi:hypothetical protein
VWNMRRVLYYLPLNLYDKPCRPFEGKVSLPGAQNISEIVDAARQLEINKDFRDAFFAEPILVPGARRWVHQWCKNASEILYEALLRHPVLRHKLTPGSGPFKPPQ